MLDVLGFPPGAHQERNHGERHMPDEHDRSGIEVDRADRQVIEQAAAQLRHGAIRAATRTGAQAHRVRAGAGARRAGPPRSRPMARGPRGDAARVRMLLGG